MRNLLIIGAGGFLGAIARYAVAGLVQQKAASHFPAGTLAVNVIGCALLGGLLAMVETRPSLTPDARLFLSVGILGSFTTFSAFGSETFDLARTGMARFALLNVMAHVFVGLLAVWAGRLGVRALIG
ncbi:MAG: putative fluoride ion transporter CrcB [Gemmatimonadota bacterium]|nr:MAG: putative fluoride ion transporter CrcB [Gemmatimonadota bacterium]